MAKEHGDIVKQVIEECKLAVANELKEKFLEMFNELGRKSMTEIKQLSYLNAFRTNQGCRF